MAAGHPRADAQTRFKQHNDTGVIRATVGSCGTSTEIPTISSLVNCGPGGSELSHCGQVNRHTHTHTFQNPLWSVHCSSPHGLYSSTRQGLTLYLCFYAWEQMPRQPRFFFSSGRSPHVSVGVTAQDSTTASFDFFFPFGIFLYTFFTLASASCQRILTNLGTTGSVDTH